MPRAIEPKRMPARECEQNKQQCALRVPHIHAHHMQAAHLPRSGGEPDKARMVGHLARRGAGLHEEEVVAAQGADPALLAGLLAGPAGAPLHLLHHQLMIVSLLIERRFRPKLQ